MKEILILENCVGRCRSSLFRARFNRLLGFLLLGLGLLVSWLLVSWFLLSLLVSWLLLSLGLLRLGGLLLLLAEHLKTFLVHLTPVCHGKSVRERRVVAPLTCITSELSPNISGQKTNETGKN